jgi:hypothetical protein
MGQGTYILYGTSYGQWKSNQFNIAPKPTVSSRKHFVAHGT